MAGLIAVGYFLASLLFDLLLFALWARIFLRYFRISSLNSFSRLIYTLTNPILYPIHFLFKYRERAQQKYDWITLVAIVLVEIIKISLLSLILMQTLLPPVLFIIYVLADLIIQPCTLLFYAILIRVIMSYVNPHWRHPFADFLVVITQPLLIVGRKIIPDISGFDFSPFVMMALLKVITLFIQASLPIHML